MSKTDKTAPIEVQTMGQVAEQPVSARVRTKQQKSTHKRANRAARAIGHKMRNVARHLHGVDLDDLADVDIMPVVVGPRLSSKCYEHSSKSHVVMVAA